MNILLFVFSMLIILSSLTYTSLANFQQSSLLQIEYQRYLHAREEGVYWDEASKLYDAEKVSEGKKRGGSSRMLAKLNIKPLFTDEDPTLMRQMFIRLIESAYQGQAFFQVFMEESSLENLLEALQGLEITSDAKLAEAEIEDPMLRNFLVKIINGRVVPVGEQGGYPPLTKLATVSGSRKASLYLAPREVLLAIIEDEGAVQDLMARRMEIYQAMDREELGPVEGKSEWKAFIEGRLFSLPNARFVDYGVSLTKPKN